MKNSKHKILITLSLPIICLLLLVIYKQIKISTGKTIVIPITGYDPRDLLSGHFLTYRLDIETGNACSGNEDQDKTVYLCLEQKTDSTVTGFRIEDMSEAFDYECGIVIKGKCDYNTFIAGIERFYIPEEHAAYLDNIIRKGKCSLEVKINGKGKASIRDMLIDGKSWKEYLREEPGKK